MAKKRVPHIVTQQIELIHEVFGLAINDSEIFPWWFLETYYVAQALGVMWSFADDVLREVLIHQPLVTSLDEILPYDAVVTEDTLLVLVREKHPVLADAFGVNLPGLFLGAAVLRLQVKEGWPPWPSGQARLLTSVNRANPLWLINADTLGGIKEATRADYIQFSQFHDWAEYGYASPGRPRKNLEAEVQMVTRLIQACDHANRSATWSNLEMFLSEENQKANRAIPDFENTRRYLRKAGYPLERLKEIARAIKQK